LTSAPRRLLLISSAVVVTIALLATGLVLTATNWSTLMKMLPAPRVERIVLEGDAASGTVIDCRGEWFNEGKPTELVIRSRQTAAGWERPENVVIRNCRIRGSIRIMGMSRNGEGDEVRKSSVSPGHTERVQAAAPTKILISDVEIEADYRIPLYVAPGVTNVTFERSRITGWGCSTAVYLDCESGGNVIAGNVFDTRTLGLFAHAIWLGSRNGRSNYCHQDDGHPFGSSSDNRDFANDNEVRNNRFEPPSPRAIRDDGAGNVISP